MMIINPATSTHLSPFRDSTPDYMVNLKQEPDSRLYVTGQELWKPPHFILTVSCYGKRGVKASALLHGISWTGEVSC